jgi:hypothetical protein
MVPYEALAKTHTKSSLNILPTRTLQVFDTLDNGHSRLGAKRIEGSAVTSSQSSVFGTLSQTSSLLKKCPEASDPRMEQIIYKS